jgi:hypothetical protein
MPGLNEPPRHVRAHIAETDKADVHHTLSFPISSCPDIGERSDAVLRTAMPGHDIIEHVPP